MLPNSFYVISCPLSLPLTLISHLWKVFCDVNYFFTLSDALLLTTKKEVTLSRLEVWKYKKDKLYLHTCHSQHVPLWHYVSTVRCTLQNDAFYSTGLLICWAASSAEWTCWTPLAKKHDSPYYFSSLLFCGLPFCCTLFSHWIFS